MEDSAALVDAIILVAGVVLILLASVRVSRVAITTAHSACSREFETAVGEIFSCPYDRARSRPAADLNRLRSTRGRYRRVGIDRQLRYA